MIDLQPDSGIRDRDIELYSLVKVGFRLWKAVCEWECFLTEIKSDSERKCKNKQRRKRDSNVKMLLTVSTRYFLHHNRLGILWSRYKGRTMNFLRDGVATSFPRKRPGNEVGGIRITPNTKNPAQQTPLKKIVQRGPWRNIEQVLSTTQVQVWC